MEEEENMSPPFWLQNGGADRPRLRRSYSIFISSGTLVIILLVTVLAFTFVVVPTLHSFTSHILKPQSVKKSWDSLNLVLVLFAIFCGFLSRNNTTNESPRSYEDKTFSDTNTPNIETQTPRLWYEYSDRTPYNRLRSFRSYQDLRQESSWVGGDERWQFYDDTHVDGYRGGLHLDSEEEELKEKEDIKNIEVNTYVAREDVGRNTKRMHQSETIEKTKNNNASGGGSLQGKEEKNKKASATKELFTSLKEKKKKKKKKQSILNSEPTTASSSSHTTPPPPPPPPSSVFHNLFSSKTNKHKKHNHVSTLLASKTEPVHGGVGTIKQPRVSNKGDDFFSMDENVVTGNESPLTTIPPPPPPPPPFKMPAWKFRVQGDFVRIDSISSSSSGQSDIDEVAESPKSEARERDHGGEPAILLVYPSPSPDVDTKADNFIENFRAGLRRSRRVIGGRSKEETRPS